MSQQNDQARYETKGDAHLDREHDSLGDLPRNLPFPAGDIKRGRQVPPPKAVDEGTRKTADRLASVFDAADSEFERYQTELDRRLDAGDTEGLRQHLAGFRSIPARHQAVLDAIHQGLKTVR